MLWTLEPTSPWHKSIICWTSIYIHHLLQVQRRFLKTEAWRCHGLPGVCYFGQLLRRKWKVAYWAPSKEQHGANWFRYVDGTWVKIKTQTQEVEFFMEHLKSVDRNIRFTREDMKENRLPFLDHTPWEWWRAKHWSLLETFSHRPVPAFQPSPPFRTHAGSYQNPPSP